MKRALENGYTIIRISQLDIFHDKIDWQTLLTNVIKPYDEPCIKYLSSIDKLYDEHKYIMAELLS